MRGANQQARKIATQLSSSLGWKVLLLLMASVAIVFCLVWYLQFTQLGSAEKELVSTAAPDEESLWLAVTADYNGLLTDTYSHQRGWIPLQSLLAKIQNQSHHRLILLDAGDSLFGSSSSVLPQESLREKPPADKYGNLPAIQLMNQIGWDAMAIGNYDLNAKHLEKSHSASDFAWLAANALNPQGEPVFTPYVIVKRGNISVGVLGFGQPGLRASAAEWRGPWRMGSIRAGLRRWVPHLRKVEKVNLVIALMHSGADPFYGWERAATENQPLPAAASLVAWKWKLPPEAHPDLVLSGGSHRLSYAPLPYQQLRWQIPAQPIPLLEVGSSGRGLMLVRIKLKSHPDNPSNQRTPPSTPPSTPPKISAAAILLPSLTPQQTQLPNYAKKRFLAAQHSLNTPTDWHFVIPKLLKRQRRPFTRCLGNLQHQALKNYLQLNSIAAPAPLLSLLPLPKILYAQQWKTHPKQHTPVLRKHIYRWLYYPNQIVQFHAQGKQIAILLTGMVRWKNNYSPRGLTPLYPGGFTFQQKPKSKTSDIKSLLIQNSQTPQTPQIPLRWRKKYLVWSTDFIRQGHNTIATRALLQNPPIQYQLPFTLREIVFQYMKNENQPPENCKKFLAR